PMRYGLGCMLEQQADQAASKCMGPNTFGHVGLGGPVSFADPERDVSFGFVTTTIGSHVLLDPRVRKLATLAYAAL
ncbi:MAG: EstA family serine hydrolase, partial [Pseudomonas helleri]